MVAINLNAAGVIQFEAARDAFRLYPAVGGAQIELTMRAWRADERKESLPCTVVATMSVGRHPNVGQRPVCDLRYAHIFSPTTQGNQVQLKGFITDHQLRVIEEIRNGVALWVNLELAVTCLDGDPRQLLESWGNEPISIQSGEWAEALSVSTLAPTSSFWCRYQQTSSMPTLYGACGTRATWCGTTRSKKRWVSRARPWRKSARPTRPGRWLLPPPRRTRGSTRRRNAGHCMSKASSHLLSGAVHDDQGTTENFVWTRAEAGALITSVAALLARLAEDERSHVPSAQSA